MSGLNDRLKKLEALNDSDNNHRKVIFVHKGIVEGGDTVYREADYPDDEFMVINIVDAGEHFAKYGRDGV